MKQFVAMAKSLLGRKKIFAALGGGAKKKKILLAALAAAAAVHLFLRLSPYPEFERLKNEERSVRFYDRSGILLQVTSVKDGLRREWTDIEKIPAKVKKAFLKAEDRRFYFHLGIDPISAAGAAIQNAGAKRTVRGASTITMQLAKLASGGGRRSMEKKNRRGLERAKNRGAAFQDKNFGALLKLRSLWAKLRGRDKRRADFFWKGT